MSPRNGTPRKWRRRRAVRLRRRNSGDTSVQIAEEITSAKMTVGVEDQPLDVLPDPGQHDAEDEQEAEGRGRPAFIDPPSDPDPDRPDQKRPQHEQQHESVQAGRHTTCPPSPTTNTQRARSQATTPTSNRSQQSKNNQRRQQIDPCLNAPTGRA